MRSPRTADVALLALALALTPSFAGAAGPRSEEGTSMIETASGAFDVEAAPADEESHPDGNALGRYSLEKTYHGDLEATARGEMLTASTPVDGSAGYVAFERVEGTLHGRSGSFVLQHLGRMGHGEQQLDIRILRDSGTGELEGIDGTFRVTITSDGEHLYELEYTLDSR